MLNMRVKVATVLAAGAAIVAAATPGVAQDGGGRVPQWSAARASGQNVEIQFYQGFARCVGFYGRAFGEALVSTAPHSTVAVNAGKRIGEYAGGCLSRGSARLNADRARGAIAEVLLKTADKTPLTGTSPFTKSETLQSFMSKIGPAEVATVMAGLSDAAASKTVAAVPPQYAARWASYCAAKENYASVWAVLQTQQGSRRELQALDALNPTLGKCLSGDLTLTSDVRVLSRLSRRGTLLDPPCRGRAQCVARSASPLPLPCSSPRRRGAGNRHAAQAVQAGRKRNGQAGRAGVPARAAGLFQLPAPALASERRALPRHNSRNTRKR
jgi:hypothetical protein